jgi:ATP-dependent Clp protease ATP-binding subunit ClpB
MEIESQPVELDAIERKILQLNIETQALARETDKNSLKRLEKIKAELAELSARRDSLQLQWTNEKEAIASIREKKARLEQLKSEEVQSERSGDLAKAAQIKHGLIPALMKEIAHQSGTLDKMQDGQRLLREEVSDDDIARIVSNWTGIPVAKMLSSEMEKYVNLEHILSERVIGQEDAIRAVSDAIRRNKTGIGDERRPLGSFLFAGPTGVGKTELAKVLASFLFDDEKALTRIDMSEYMEKFSVSRLIGAPPGYVGYDQGGQLTEVVRRRPYSVILFDEIEKAHPDVFNILLQLLDDGRLTDGQGRVVDFTNTIVIMTSNLGSELLLNARSFDEARASVEMVISKSSTGSTRSSSSTVWKKNRSEGSFPSSSISLPVGLRSGTSRWNSPARRWMRSHKRDTIPISVRVRSSGPYRTWWRIHWQNESSRASLPMAMRSRSRAMQIVGS